MFLNAHRCLEEGIEPKSERAWLFKIAEHVVMYRRRTISRRARVEFPIDVDSLADLVVAPGREVPAELHGLPEALARIPEAQQRAIVLREWYGLSYREVAAELGISASAAETLIFRARRRLAQELGGPPQTVRKRTPLSLASPLASSFNWLFGGGTTVKALVGATSLAVLAVGSARVSPLHHPAPSVRAAAPARVLVPPSAPASRHVPPLRRTSVAPRLHVRTAGAPARHRPAPVVTAPTAAPVAVVTTDPVETVAAPDQDAATESVAAGTPATAPPEEDRSQAAVETPSVLTAELLVATDAPAASLPAAEPPVDAPASDPGQSGGPQGPNEMAASGQAERSEHVPENAAVPGTQGQGAGAGPHENQGHGAGPKNGEGPQNGAGPQNGDALPQPANEGAPDLAALPGGPAATDSTAEPGNGGSGGPPPQAQGAPASPGSHEPSAPHGEGNGPPEHDGADLASAVAV